MGMQFSFAAKLSLALCVLTAPLLHAAEPAHKIRLAIYDAKGSFGKGVPCICTEINKSADMSVTKVKPQEIRDGILTNFDVVAFTGGSAGAQSEALGAEGRAKVKEFVEQGGGYLGICAGAYLACVTDKSDLGVIAARTVSPKWQRGEGTVQIALNENGKKFFNETNEVFDIHYQNGPILKPAKSDTLPAFQTLASFHTEIAENKTPVGIMVNSPAIVSSTCGQGRVIVISPHPEQTEGLEHFVSAAVQWLGAGK